MPGVGKVPIRRQRVHDIRVAWEGSKGFYVKHPRNFPLPGWHSLTLATGRRYTYTSVIKINVTF